LLLVIDLNAIDRLFRNVRRLRANHSHPFADKPDPILCQDRHVFEDNPSQTSRYIGCGDYREDSFYFLCFLYVDAADLSMRKRAAQTLAPDHAG
jgi:hypothetical protein